MLKGILTKIVKDSSAKYLAKHVREFYSKPLKKVKTSGSKGTRWSRYRN